MWKPRLLVRQQAIGTRRSYNWQIRRGPTTGVGEVGEFVEIGDGTWEILVSLR